MANWIEEEFQSADLGDRRLDTRMKMILERMANAPMLNIASALRGWSEVVAAYRFFNNPKASIEGILRPHGEAIRERARQHARVLIVQDTTELDYTQKKHLADSGPLTLKERRGFLAHNHMVITPERLALGVLDTNIHARDDETHGKPKDRHLAIEEKESFRWLEGYHKACTFAQSVPGTQVISCSDREGDIYEIYRDWQAKKASGKVAADWLIRSANNRHLATPKKGTKTAPLGEHSTLREAVDRTTLLGTLVVQVTEKMQKKRFKSEQNTMTSAMTRRSARQTTLEVRAATVTLKPTYRRVNKLPEVTATIVVAKEPNPPRGEDPIAWYLLTSLKVSDFESARDVIELYRVRWQIEVFHRVLKTGCRIEELQLKNSHRVFVAVALYMVVAWRVMYVMKLGLECPDLPCDVIFDEDEWRALWVIAHGEKALTEPKPSLGAFMATLAEFGGFLGRTSDGPPGPQSIWIGLGRLRDFAVAWQHFGKGHYPGS